MPVSDDMVSKRLRAVDQSQESIEIASMWIMHHKDSAHVIVNGWMNTFRLVNEAHKIALFYVANDVCQKAKKKSGLESLVSAFVPHIINAIAISRGCESMKRPLTRMLAIWEERMIFARPVLIEMKTTLADPTDSEDVGTAFEFDLPALIADLEKFQKIEVAIDKARVILSRGNFDFQSQMKDRLKDRAEGSKFLTEVEQSCKKMCEFVTALEQQMKQHHRLIELLENARRFFAIQLRDATVVNDAYQKFGNGIENVKQELEEMMRTGAYLGASPPRDAPSPQPSDDPFISGVEQAIQEMRRPGARDIIEPFDMDVDDDSTPTSITAGMQYPNINPGFIARSAELQRMLNVATSASTRKADPRLERAQRVEKSEVPGGNATMATSDPGGSGIAAIYSPTSMSPPIASGAPPPWMAGHNFGHPPPAFLPQMPPPAFFPHPSMQANGVNLPPPGMRPPGSGRFPGAHFPGGQRSYPPAGMIRGARPDRPPPDWNGSGQAGGAGGGGGQNRGNLTVIRS